MVNSFIFVMSILRDYVYRRIRRNKAILETVSCFLCNLSAGRYYKLSLGDGCTLLVTTLSEM